MKSSKSTKAKPAEEEECGIWLDTKELKEKKQQVKSFNIFFYTMSMFFQVYLKYISYKIYTVFRNRWPVRYPDCWILSRDLGSVWRWTWASLRPNSTCLSRDRAPSHPSFPPNLEVTNPRAVSHCNRLTILS